MKFVAAKAGRLVPAMACLTVGLAIGSSGLLRTQADQVGQPQAAVNPRERGVDANLYVQTSAEYVAVCLQTYHWGLERLRAKLAAGKPGNARPAVVMDLDETVFDNSGFQTVSYRDKQDYSAALWEEWERNHPHDVGLVPGAKGFIEAAEQLGVAVVYISNRLTKNEAATVEALKRLGLSIQDINERLLLRADTSDKTARRQAAERRFNVLLYVGDNLRDFSEEFVAPRVAAGDLPAQQRAVRERLAKVQRAAYRWGNDWIILPNPVYGEWQNLTAGDPLKFMRPYTAPAPGK